MNVQGLQKFMEKMHVKLAMCDVKTFHTNINSLLNSIFPLALEETLIIISSVLQGILGW